jgi:tripartite-type tricarboxylate transporter receptor subunit TctC
MEESTMNRPLYVSLALLIPALCLAPGAFAQTYPTKPVRVIIPFAPGGASSTVGRLVFQKVSEIMDQQFIVDNRAGAAGTIGAEIVSRSAPDGYTLLVHTATHIANAHLYKKLPYDTLGDFVGVTALGRQVGMMAVHPSMPVRSVKALVALARARPGDIVYSSAGNGSFSHLGMALFTSMTGTRLIHVPYKGGGPAGFAIVSGETQATMNSIGAMFAHVKSGRLRALGVSSETRTTQFPEVPAIAEFVPGYEFTAWVGCFAPAGTPGPIIDALNAALKRALEDPGVAAKLSAQTLDPMPMSPGEFARRLQSDFEKYGKVVAASGARID